MNQQRHQGIALLLINKRPRAAIAVPWRGCACGDKHLTEGVVGVVA